MRIIYITTPGGIRRVEEDVRSLLLTILAVAALTACGGGDDAEERLAAPTLSAAATPSSSATPVPATATTMAIPTRVPTAAPTQPARATATVTPGPATATAPDAQSPPVLLPRDDSSHPSTVEWWYYNGHLEAEDGFRYGFHYVFFEVLSSTTRTFFHLGQLGISDHRKGMFTFEQRFGTKGPEPREGFRAVVDDWRMSGYDGEFELRASLDEYAFDLRLSAIKPAVAHGKEGIVNMGFAGESYYYTYPRLRATGTFTDRGEIKAVTGDAWMDHQWGDFQVARVGWDWFAIQLDDNTEVLISVVRNLEDGATIGFGTYVDAEGDPRAITAQDVTLRTLGRWHSPESGIDYPSGWELEIGSLGLSLRLTPLIADSELYVPTSVLPTYWEGEVVVQGERDGGPIAGHGFVELVGYSRTEATGTPVDTPTPTPAHVPTATVRPTSTPIPMPSPTSTTPPAPTPTLTATPTPTPPPTSTPTPIPEPSPLSMVNDFLYQLQDLDLSAIGNTAYDLIVMDYSAERDEEGEFEAAEIAALKDSPGGEKIVLAYMSIGEAEDYRFYSRSHYAPGTPDWLDVVNPDWTGNYKVRYWDIEWQSIVFEYIDRLLDAGFDGAYLDIIDAYEYYADRGRTSAAREMADFVAAIAAYARARDPDFYIFPQNAPELASLVPAYLDSVDGIGQEDIYYGYDDDDRPTPPSATTELEGYLDVFQDAGKLVLTIDYASTPAYVEDAYTRSRARGYVPFVAVRDLDRLTVNPGQAPD